MNTMHFNQAPYPLDSFHLVSQNAAREVRWHLKAPDALIGMSFLTIMTIACQSLADVAIPIFDSSTSTPNDQDEENDGPVFLRIPLNMNLISIAESGERKTTVDRIVGRPIYDHDEKRIAKHDSDISTHETDLSIWQSIERGLRRKLAKLAESGKPTDETISTLKEHATKKPAPVRQRRIVRSDISKTAIAEALHGEGESIALMSNEGDILLNGEAMKHLSWLNSAWDGSSLQLDRANNKSLLARNPRVTTSMLVQPSVFHDYMDSHGQKARGLGYFARYLIGWPRSTQGKRFISGREGAWKHLPIFHARVRDLLEEYDRRVVAGTHGRDVIHFTDEAKARWIELVNNTEQLIQPYGALREVKDFAAKACEITARVAGTLHYFSGQIGGMTIDTLERAIAIVTWHLEECDRLFVQMGDVPRALKDAERLRKYLCRMQKEQRERNEDPYRIVRNEAHHCGPLRKGRFAAALDILEARNIVWVDPMESNTTIYRKRSGPLYIFFSDRLGYPLQ
jgi:hypothetical protein